VYIALRPVLGVTLKVTLEDAIGSHACSLEALACMQPMAFISGVHSSYKLTLSIAFNPEGKRSMATAGLDRTIQHDLNTYEARLSLDDVLVFRAEAQCAIDRDPELGAVLVCFDRKLD
jgi:hypothetical protein